MQAAVYAKTAPDFSTISIQRVPLPEPGPGQVVVKVNVAGANPADYLIYAHLFKVEGHQFTPGYDLAGTVAALGAGVQGLAVGDRVFSMNFNWGTGIWQGLAVGGAFAEYSVVNAHQLSKIPANVSDEVAAAAAMIANTSQQALFETIKLQAGQRVLIVGGASGCGSMGIQLAKLAGAYVVTTCSTASIPYVQQYGPDQIIDYTKDKWEQVLANAPVDAVYDCVNDNQSFARARTILKQGGTYAVITRGHDAGDNPAAYQPAIRWAGFHVTTGGTAVQDYLIKLVAEGKLKVHIEQVLPFTNEGVRALFQHAGVKKSKPGKYLLRIAQ